MGAPQLPLLLYPISADVVSKYYIKYEHILLHPPSQVCGLDSVQKLVILYSALDLTLSEYYRSAGI